MYCNLRSYHLDSCHLVRCRTPPVTSRTMPACQCRTSCKYDIVRATYDIVLNIVRTMSYVRYTVTGHRLRNTTDTKHGRSAA